jgi:hypothetical protein
MDPSNGSKAKNRLLSVSQGTSSGTRLGSVFFRAVYYAFFPATSGERSAGGAGPGIREEPESA